MIDPLRGMPLSTSALPSAKLDRSRPADAAASDPGAKAPTRLDSSDVRTPTQRETFLKNITAGISQRETELARLETRSAAVASIGERLDKIAETGGGETAGLRKEIASKLKDASAQGVAFEGKLARAVESNNLDAARSLVADESDSLDKSIDTTSRRLAQARVEFENASSSLLPRKAIEAATEAMKDGAAAEIGEAARESVELGGRMDIDRRNVLLLLTE